MKTRLLLLSLAIPGIASAHTVNGDVSGLMHGLMHPLSGIDHLLAIIAVGLWASQQRNQGQWALPLGFVGLMLVGGLIAFSGIQFPWVEQGILMSVLILGVLAAGAFRLPVFQSTLLVGSMAVFHGLAHGLEMPTAMNSLSYSLGFAISTALLLIASIRFMKLLTSHGLEGLGRLAGAAIAFGGVALALA